MHLCLSCNQPCNLSSVFCDTCRLSLLERSEEEPGMVSVGGGQEEVANPASVAQAGSGKLEPQPELAGNTSTRQTEEEYLWSWDTSRLYSVDTLAGGNGGDQTASLTLVSPTVPVRRVMPKRVRIALMIFLIVGALALTTDGFLLALSIIRHHTQSTSPSVGTIAPDGGPERVMLTPTGPTSITPGATAITLANALSLSSSHLLFVATQGQPDPPPQAITLTSNESNGFDWQVVSTLPSWLHLSSMRGSATAGAQAKLVVGVSTAGLAPGSYNDPVEIKALDSKGNTLPDGLQEFNIVLNVLTPCVLAVTPAKLSFNSNLLQPAPPTQTLTLTENGDCSRPVSWQISSNASWVTFSNASGTDTGAGSAISVQATNPNKLVGTYTATLTLQAFDSKSEPLAGSPATVPVTLTVII
jgi:Viral BACON domain